MADEFIPVARTLMARDRQRPRYLFIPYADRAKSVLILGMMAFLVGAVLSAGAAVLPSPIWASAALAAFIVYSIALLQRSPATFLLLAPLIALRITEFLSGAAIEAGAYMTETMFRGVPTGAFAHLLIIYVLFFTCAALFVESVWPKMAREFADAPERWTTSASTVWWVMLVVFAIASAYLIRLGINNGFPLLSHIDRFQYLRKLDSPYYKAWMFNRIVLAPFLGLLFATPRYRLRSLAMLLWLLGSSVLFGEKFSSLLMIISIFVMPVGLVHISRGGKIDLTVVGLVVGSIALITVPAVLLVYGAQSDINSAMQRYGDRIALQGQMWYQADRKFLKPFAWDPEAITADAESWLDITAQDSTATGDKFGLYYVMEPFTPSQELGWNMEGGGGYVFVLYPYLMMVSGVLGMLIMSSLIAVYHAAVMYWMMQALSRSKWIAGLAFGRAMSSIFATYSGGYLWNVFGIKNVLTLALGLGILAMGNKSLPLPLPKILGGARRAGRPAKPEPKPRRR